MSVVIIGAGQAGAWTARTLRNSGYTAPVLLLGQEWHAPYERPPLSKGVLGGTQSAPPVLLTSEQAESQCISIRLGTEVVSIDRAARHVACADGRQISYDKLVIATGGKPRRLPLPNANPPGVFELRTIDDAGAIGRRLAAGSRLLVIGGGWIGLEVAATARQKGVAVTLVEAGERLCARSVPPVLGDFLLARHIGQGVLIRLKTTVQSIEPGDAGRVLVNIDGENGQFDAVVVGIGIVPNTRLASDCGLKVTDGIVVDASGAPRTRMSMQSETLRISIVVGPTAVSGLSLGRTNAQNQAIYVGTAIAGIGIPYDDLPWFGPINTTSVYWCSAYLRSKADRSCVDRWMIITSVSSSLLTVGCVQ